MGLPWQIGQSVTGLHRLGVLGSRADFAAQMAVAQVCEDAQCRVAPVLTTNLVMNFDDFFFENWRNKLLLDHEWSWPGLSRWLPSTREESREHQVNIGPREVPS